MSTGGIELTSFKNGIEFKAPSNEKIYLSTSPLVKPFSPPEKTPALNWSQRAVVQLNDFDTQLDQWFPDNVIQKNIDRLGHLIQRKFSRLEGFNEWLDSNGEGAWHMQLATALAKLPLRAARNIIQLLYTLIKEILFFANHPLKGLNEIAKMLIALVYALTQPETYTKIGIGMIGAGIGQGLITGNPLSVIAVGIGAALTLAGLSAGALKAAVQAERGHRNEAALENFFAQGKTIPETFLTGFLMGVLMGAIQKAAYKKDARHYKTSLTDKEARAEADRFIEKNHLPKYNYIYNSGDRIYLRWSGNDAALIQAKFPSYNWNVSGNVHYISIRIESFTSSWHSSVYYSGFKDHHYFARFTSLDAIGLRGGSYTPPVTTSYAAFTHAAPSVASILAAEKEIKIS